MDPETRKEQILDAASRVCAAKGYHNASVSEIISEAGIARGTFYLYFNSKREVFSELMDSLTERLQSCLKRVDLSAESKPWTDQIRDNVRRLVSILLDERELTMILYNHQMGLDKEYDTKIKEFYSQLTNNTAGALKLGQEMGLLRQDINPRLAALHMVGSVKEVIHHIAAYGEPGIPVEELVNEMMEYHLNGIKTKENDKLDNNNPG
jgi:AcrR family transcriptional regulator